MWSDETQRGGDRHASGGCCRLGGMAVSEYFRHLVLRDAGELPHGRTITTDVYTVRGSGRGPGCRQQHDARRLRGNGGWCFMDPQKWSPLRRWSASARTELPEVATTFKGRPMLSWRSGKRLLAFLVDPGEHERTRRGHLGSRVLSESSKRIKTTVVCIL